MAKKRRISSDRNLPSGQSTTTESLPSVQVRFSRITSVASLVLVGIILAYAHFHPSDSVAVENGDALWLTVWTILLAGMALIAGNTSGVAKRADGGVLWLPDVLACALAGWMMIAAQVTSPPGNLRMATNEAWVWTAMAAYWVGIRRVAAQPRAATLLLWILIALGLGQACHGLFQQWVSLPALQQQFERSPDQVLMQAGIDAPVDSAERLVFADRLFDGGPTG
ncbi:MAG: hypothetical protein AAGA03_04060, partial [Planctomycetota bacterium]